jgi:hypothetical protein
VLAHNPGPLQYLLDALDARFRILVHMDAKTDLATLAEAALRLPAHARLVAPRIPVFWGGWSMMRATLALIEAALAEADYERLVLLSGDSLPVRDADAIEATLLESEAEFIDMMEVPDDSSLAGVAPEAAVASHGWVQPWRFHNHVHWDHLLLNPATRETTARHYGLDANRADWLRGDAQALVAELLQELPPRPRLFAHLRYGSQWWGLSGRVLRMILPELQRPDVQSYFRHMQVPDEHMVHTVLANHAAALQGRVLKGSLVWSVAGPAGTQVLDDAGFAAAPAQGARVLFARKFDPAVSPALASRLRDGL